MNECNEHAGPAEPDEPLSGERVAHNEATARQINESIEDGRMSRDGLTGFVCQQGPAGRIAEATDPRAEDG